MLGGLVGIGLLGAVRAWSLREHAHYARNLAPVLAARNVSIHSDLLRKNLRGAWDTWLSSRELAAKVFVHAEYGTLNIEVEQALSRYRELGEEIRRRCLRDPKYSGPPPAPPPRLFR